jgi:predicted alternative tryptophan synthase beta-subunit
MLAREVPGVISALTEHGIEVVAVHNHMVYEEPRIFFLHYWGVGPAEALAKGLKAAIDQTGKEKQQDAAMITGFLLQGNETFCGVKSGISYQP